MIVAALAGGAAVGCAVTFLARPQRSIQLAALGVMALALAVAMAAAGAGLPALFALLLYGISALVVLGPLSRMPPPDAVPRSRRGRMVSIALAAGVGVATMGLLLGAGVATRAGFPGAAVAPGLAEVGKTFLLGAAVPTLGALVLTATVVAAVAVLVKRDRREALAEQAEAARRRRLEQQQRRARQREEARAAARAQRRGSRQ